MPGILIFDILEPVAIMIFLASIIYSSLPFFTNTLWLSIKDASPLISLILFLFNK